MNIGMIGLDSSHAIAFTEILNDPSHPYHVSSGNVIHAYPGGSKDLEISQNRIKKFTKQIEYRFDVKLVSTPEELAEAVDAIFITSLDAKTHLPLLKRVAPYKLPVFIDKPLALSTKDALEILNIADVYQVPVMSASALRYADELLVIRNGRKDIMGAYLYGPTPLLEDVMPGFFWYGIHSVEMLFAILGGDCQSVRVVNNDSYDVVVGEWKDGRMGIIRGDRVSNGQFGGVCHYQETHHGFQIGTDLRAAYSRMLQQVINFFQSGVPEVHLLETLKIIRFIEAANESGTSGKTIQLI